MCEKCSQHMETLRDKSPWAVFMTYLGTNQLETAHLIFPWAAVGVGDLVTSERWSEWYGRHLDVRAATALLKANSYIESADTGSTLDAEDEPTVDVK